MLCKCDRQMLFYLLYLKLSFIISYLITQTIYHEEGIKMFIRILVLVFFLHYSLLTFSKKTKVMNKLST